MLAQCLGTSIANAFVNVMQKGFEMSIPHVHGKELLHDISKCTGSLCGVPAFGLKGLL